MRIAGINLPKNKRIVIGLTYIVGIGKSSANKILQQAKINPDKKTDKITQAEEKIIAQLVDKNYRVEEDLRRKIRKNIKILQETGAYRGIRHKKNLPVRGQRTKTNSRTVRGNKRRTMGSGRANAIQKT